MTNDERLVLEDMRRSLECFKVEVATKLVPRDELDRREADLWQSVMDARRLSWQVGLGLGILNLGLFGTVLGAVLAR